MCFYAHFTSHEPVSTVRFTHASIHISNASSFSISHFPTAHVFDACSVTVRQFTIIFFRKQKQNNARKKLTLLFGFVRFLFTFSEIFFPVLLPDGVRSVAEETTAAATNRQITEVSIYTESKH